MFISNRSIYGIVLCRIATVVVCVARVLAAHDMLCAMCKEMSVYITQALYFVSLVH